MSKNIEIINTNTVDYHERCFTLTDGTIVYKYIPECEGCAEPYCQDVQGNKIVCPDFTNAIPCEESTFVDCVESICNVNSIGQRINLVNIGQELEVTLVIDGVTTSNTFTVVQPTTDVDSSVSAWVASVAGGIWDFIFGADVSGNIGAVSFTGSEYNYLMESVSFSPLGSPANVFNIEGNCEVTINKAQLTTGCNDTRRDDLIEEVLTELQSCKTECIQEGEGGFDFTGVPRICTKVNFDTPNNAFNAVCPDNWTTQDMVDMLNEGNPNGATFQATGEIITVTNDTSPTSIWLVSYSPPLEVVQTSGGEIICAKRVKDCNSDKQTELLQEIADNTCPSSVTSNVVCNTSAVTVDLASGGTANLAAGQEILLGEVYDCKGNLQSFSVSVLLGGILEEITTPIATGNCPSPSETIPTGCITDEKGAEWDSFQTVLNGTTITYYQDAITGIVGTPSGDPSSWSACGDLIGDSCDNPIFTENCTKTLDWVFLDSDVDGNPLIIPAGAQSWSISILDTNGADPSVTFSNGTRSIPAPIGTLSGNTEQTNDGSASDITIDANGNRVVVLYAILV